MTALTPAQKQASYRARQRLAQTVKAPRLMILHGVVVLAMPLRAAVPLVIRVEASSRPLMPLCVDLEIGAGAMVAHSASGRPLPALAASIKIEALRAIVDEYRGVLAKR